MQNLDIVENANIMKGKKNEYLSANSRMGTHVFTAYIIDSISSIRMVRRNGY